MTVDLDEIERMLSLASREPWTAGPLDPDGQYEGWTVDVPFDDNGHTVALAASSEDEPSTMSEADAKLVVMLRNIAPELIAELKQQRESMARLEAAFKDCSTALEQVAFLIQDDGSGIDRTKLREECVRIVTLVNERAAELRKLRERIGELEVDAGCIPWSRAE